MLDQLPGGFCQVDQLQQLAEQHAALGARCEALAAKCVPRPAPPQYHALQQEVGGWCLRALRPLRC